MGSKTEARKLMEAAGVPTVPGYNQKPKDDDELIAKAKEIGYPVLLKAAAGGGGKGMRLVEKEEDLVSAYHAASREAEKAFKDSLVYIEKYIVGPKHIEIQIMADKHGNYVYLAERDCSIQRRHQKVIEEAPSNVLTPELRATMGEVAIDAAKAVDYTNAGTIEFLLDINKDFYFLEMNTRLQVEHPVTEIVTHTDLAREQILVAAGERLSFTQDDIAIHGHAIECRIYAEDATSGFMPDIGPIKYMREPKGPGVRVDSGIEWGGEIGLHFDPMISKLITYANTRREAIDRMTAALDSYKILGFKTIIPFLKEVMKEDTFRNGWFDTGYLEKVFDFSKLEDHKEESEDIAAIAAWLKQKKEQDTLPKPQENPVNRWQSDNLLIRKMV
jgi:propionyl-CoA carboxylase alpha chain